MALEGECGEGKTNDEPWRHSDEPRAVDSMGVTIGEHWRLYKTGGSCQTAPTT